MGKSLSVSCEMVAREPEELVAISRKMVSISLGLAGFNVLDPQALPRSRVSRPSSPIYVAGTESLGDIRR
jgi:hypothetical protein